MKSSLTRIFILSVVIFTTQKYPLWAESPAPKEIQEAAIKILKDKTITSGSLDLYDESIKKVRNIRLINKDEVTITAQGDSYKAAWQGRDISRGDDITVETMLSKNAEGWQAKEFTIADIKAMDSLAARKEFTDDDIRKFAQNYLEQQAKFTGSIMLYDEENKKLRKLQFDGLKEGVKRFGNLSIIRGNFKDSETKETLAIDVTVKKVEGRLSVDSLLIRDISKPK